MDPDSRQSLITRTFELLKQGETEIKLHEQYKDVILILGDTGSGKSKFTTLISGDNAKLISVETGEGTDEYTIENIDDTSRSIITSDTIFPQLKFDAETNTVSSDNPGWNDSRNESLEVTANFFIHKVVRHAERIKMIFTINYPSVSPGIERHNFMKLAANVADFIRNIDKFRDSILLLVTKVDNRYKRVKDEFVLIDNNTILNGIANFLTGVKQKLEMGLLDGSSNERQLHEFAIKFISILLVKDGAGQYTRIGIFRRPDKPGPVGEISLMQDEKRRIKRLIHEKLIFSEKANEDFGFTISEKCKNKIHYFVADINRTVKSCLFRIIEKLKQHFSEMMNLIFNTVKSLLDETSPEDNLEEASELCACLKVGCRSISDLVEYFRNVANPEDLVQKMKTVIHELNIEVSNDDIMEIENNAKYFNFFQIVSDRQLITFRWDELFSEIILYLSNRLEKLQESIDVVSPQISEQIDSTFQQIAKALQDQFDDNMKLLDVKEALEKVYHNHSVMLKIVNEAKLSVSANEVMKIVSNELHTINIKLPEENALYITQLEKRLIFLRAVSDTKINFKPLSWSQMFQSVVIHLNESKIFYRFLDSLHDTLSKYEMQMNKERYNVVSFEDWGKVGKPQGIVITKSNFSHFLKNIAKYKIEAFNKVKNITLTESRLEELNELLNLTLKHRLELQIKQESLIIRADYVTAKDVVAYLEQNQINGRSLLDALKSGKYKFLQIFALKKIFIDEDLSLPGVELTVISPVWEIIGTKRISLNGADGKPHNELKAADADVAGHRGKDGKPGLPGQLGGNFFAIGTTCINGHKLTVTVNGGRGGPGQHGGKGGDGISGEDVEELTDNDLPKKGGDGITRIKGFTSKIQQRWSGFNLLVALSKILDFNNEENTVYKIFGTLGEVGGDGGHGGIGGCGGNPGNVCILDLSKDSRIKICEDKGKDGDEGSGGAGGKGGWNGDNRFGVLNGVIIKEWVQQFTQTAGAAEDGQTGRPGHHTTGLQDPDPSNAITEPFKSINDYKSYAKKNLSRFKKSLLLEFITLLNNIDEIKI